MRCLCLFGRQRSFRKVNKTLTSILQDNYNHYVAISSPTTFSNGTVQISIGISRLLVIVYKIVVSMADWTNIEINVRVVASICITV